MHRRGLIMCCVILSSALSGCGRKPALETPVFDPSKAAAEAMSALDADSSGSLSAKELEAAPAIRAALQKIDADSDGTVSKEELAGRFGAYRGRNGLVMPLRYRIVMDGRPLANATVTITPEPFMGPFYTACTGTTSRDGDVSLSSKDVLEKGFAGLHPGLYRVSVVPAGAKGGEPARHADTGDAEIGQEIAQDIPELERTVPLMVTNRRAKTAEQ